MLGILESLELPIDQLEKELKKLRQAIVDGRYGERSIVGDSVLNMEAHVREIKKTIAEFKEDIKK